MCVFSDDVDDVAKEHSEQLCTDVVLNVDILFVSLEWRIDGGVVVVCDTDAEVLVECFEIGFVDDGK